MASSTNATPQPADDKTRRRLRPQALRQIWGAIDLASWKNVTITVDQRTPPGGWAIHNDRVMGLCPFHNETKPSFVIDTAKKYAKCFGCGRYFWNPIAFWAEFSSRVGKVMTYVEAARDLKDRFDLKELPNKVIGELGKRWKHRQMKRLLYVVTNAELIAAAGAAPTDSRYFSQQKAVRYLDYRGIARVWHALPIGVMFPALYLEQALRIQATKDGLDADEMWQMAQEFLAGYLDISWVGSLLLFSGDNPNEPCGVKLRRMPEQLPMAGIVDPMFGTSTGSGPAVDKEQKWISDPLEENKHGLFGLYGTPDYLVRISQQTIHSFQVVEGEFDQLHIISQQLAANGGTGDVQFMVFAGGGGDVPDLEFMKEFAFDTAYLIGDRDAGGDNFVKQALERTLNLNLRVFTWPPAVAIPNQQKIDPDDVMKHFGLAVAQQEFGDPKNYQLPYQWAAERARQDLVGADPQDVKMLTAKAANWGVYVRDRAEQEAYVQTLQTQFPNLNAAAVRLKISSAEEHEEAFIERIKMVLQARLHVIDVLHESSTTVLRVYDAVSCRYYDFKLHDLRQNMSALEALAGTDIYAFVRNQVGEPGFVSTFEELSAKGGMFYAKQSKIMAEYATTAISRLPGSLTQGAERRKLGAGFHITSRRGPDGKGEDRVHLANGLTLFRGTYDERGNLLWSKCPGPVDENVVIFAGPDRQPRVTYPQFRSEADLNRAPTLSLKELFDRVHQIISAGWDFKNHRTVCDLVTAIVLQLSIAAVFPRQIMVFFTADWSAGKSRLIGGLVSGHVNPLLCLVQAAQFMDLYTAAGIRQSMNHATVALSLDEFEKRGTDDKKSKQVSDVLPMLRGLATPGGPSGCYGTADGRGTSFHLNFPVVVAAINNSLEAADGSRFVIVEMDRRANRPSPEDILADRVDEIERLRGELPLIMFREALRLRAVHDEVRQDLVSLGPAAPGAGAPRLREMLLGPLAIMKAADRDYRRFATEFFAHYQPQLRRVQATSLGTKLFNDIMYVQAVRPRDGSIEVGQVSVAQLLAQGRASELNGANSGVLYDGQDNLLVVHWPAVVQTILRNSTEFNRQDPTALKVHASRHDYHVPDAEVEQSGVLDRLRLRLGVGVSTDQVSAFRLDAFSDAARKPAERGDGEPPDGLEVPFDITQDPRFMQRLAEMRFPKPASVDRANQSREDDLEPVEYDADWP